MDILETIKNQITSHAIILYMKGSPTIPQCGFSYKAAKILIDCGAKFHYIDILKYPEIREHLPKYGNWPTFPQLWINGKLVGGSDIMSDMFETGELQLFINSANNKC